MYDPDLHLLVDDEEIDARWHLRRVLARPERRTHDPIIRPDRPWEGRAAGLWSSVLYDRDEGESTSAGTGARDDDVEAASDRNILNYAVSDDGLTWEKPDLQARWNGKARVVTTSFIGPTILPAFGRLRATE